MPGYGGRIRIEAPWKSAGKIGCALLMALCGFGPGPVAASKMAYPELVRVRECFRRTPPGEPIADCVRALHYWIQRRSFCGDATVGADFFLMPVGTERRYRRRYADGRPEVPAWERVEHFTLDDGPTLRMWVRRKAEGVASLTEYLIDAKSGAVFLDAMHLADRAVTCRRPEIYLVNPSERGGGWTGSGCWLTDSISREVYPHKTKSVFPDLLLPGAVVDWKISVSFSRESLGPSNEVGPPALLKRSEPSQRGSESSSFEQAFMRGIGLSQSRYIESGSPVWTEELTDVISPLSDSERRDVCRVRHGRLTEELRGR